MVESLSGQMRPTRTMDTIDIRGRAQANFAYTDTANDSAALDAGIYAIWSDQDCYLKIAQSAADDVTTGTGYILLANNVEQAIVRDQDKIGAVRKTTSGTLYFHRIG